MIVLDTNVLIRFFVRDDEIAYQKVASLLKTRNVVILSTVVLEAYWVLQTMYGFGHDEIADSLVPVLTLVNADVPDRKAVLQAFDWAAAGLDFADALHLALSQNAEAVFTFDRKFQARSSRVSSVVPVLSP